MKTALNLKRFLEFDRDLIIIGIIVYKLDLGSKLRQRENLLSALIGENVLFT